MPLWGGGKGSNCQEQERSEMQMIVYGASKKRVSSVLTHHDRPHTCWRSWNLENQIRSRRLVTRGSSSRWRFGQLSPHSPTQPPLPHFSNNSFWRSDDEEFRNWKGQKWCLLCVLRHIVKKSTFNFQAAALLTPHYIGKIWQMWKGFQLFDNIVLIHPFCQQCDLTMRTFACLSGCK